MKSSEFKRWLAAQGATFENAKGSHLKVRLKGKTSFLPMHSKELKTGLVEGIKKQLGLKIGGIMLRYPAHLAPQKEGGYVVTFPDIPEAITQGEDVEDALLHAADVLESALDYYIEEGLTIPAPSKLKRGQHVVELPASYAAKMLLLNEMAVQKIRPADLARRLQMTPSEVTRLIDLHHTSRIDGIAGALKALGKTMEIRAV